MYQENIDKKQVTLDFYIIVINIGGINAFVKHKGKSIFDISHSYSAFNMTALILFAKESQYTDTVHDNNQYYITENIK